MTNLFDLTGRVAVVTGAGSGIGRAIALGLAGHGADIVAIGRRDLTPVCADVEREGSRCCAVRADLSTEGSADAIVAGAMKAFGRVDILVNNAGMIRRGDALELSAEDFDAVLSVNLRAAFLLSQAVARAIVRQGGGGKIINIASMLSYQGGLRACAYAASKHGIVGLTKAMCNDFAPHNIQVNAIAPGYIVTELNAPLIADPERNRAISERIPAGRWGQPGDLAGAAIFLASRASDYVSGACINVDGGWLAR